MNYQIEVLEDAFSEVLDEKPTSITRIAQIMNDYLVKNGWQLTRTEPENDVEDRRDALSRALGLADDSGS